MKCPKHPRYRAQRKPRVPCEACWRLFITDTDRKIVEAQKALREWRKIDCAHPVTATFTWEYDNGYGQQSMMPGLRCVACDKVNRWPGSGSWWKPITEGVE